MAINFKSRSSIEKLNELGAGGEASIHEYDSQRVIKLFKPKVDLGKKEKKVKYFIACKNALSNKVIGPEEEVTVNSKFVAYIMRKLNGTEDLHMLTKSKFLAANSLTNKDVLTIVVEVGDELQKLHQMKPNPILVGDISDFNFQMVGKSAYLLDVDSWGVIGKFDPDAYTELFTCPDSYTADGRMSFSEENENYNYAVLAFYMLTRIHPFGGTYMTDKNLSTVDRMKKRISVVGKYKNDIKIPKAIGKECWKWMSPQLEKDFIEIFEHGKKMDITSDLKELLNNLKYCDSHGNYYYSKYSECPICNQNAKVKVAPTVTKATQTQNGPQLSVVFKGANCTYILSSNHYLNTSNEVVHFESGRKFSLDRGKRIDFSNDGKIVYVTDGDNIEIYNQDNKVISSIPRLHNTNYLVKDKNLYYVDKGSNLVKLSITELGNMPFYLGQVYNALISATDDGKVFKASMYPKKAIIETHEFTFEVSYTGRISEYAIKYDKKTNSWLFAYQMFNGKYRTMVFNKNKVEYDDDVIIYNAQTLNNIDYYNNTIYDPDDGKIVGTNIIKNTAKEFECSVVDENSKLEFTGREFKIYNENKIYNYG